jgi:hypothetical protein
MWLWGDGFKWVTVVTLGIHRCLDQGGGCETASTHGGQKGIQKGEFGMIPFFKSQN